MATVTLCDHDGNPATLHVRIDSFVGSTFAEFDCCSQECVAECLSSRLAPVVEPSVDIPVDEVVAEEPEPNPEV